MTLTMHCNEQHLCISIIIGMCIQVRTSHLDFVQSHQIIRSPKMKLWMFQARSHHHHHHHHHHHDRHHHRRSEYVLQSHATTRQKLSHQYLRLLLQRLIRPLPFLLKGRDVVLVEKFLIQSMWMITFLLLSVQYLTELSHRNAYIPHPLALAIRRRNNIHLVTLVGKKRKTRRQTRPSGIHLRVDHGKSLRLWATFSSPGHDMALEMLSMKAIYSRWRIHVPWIPLYSYCIMHTKLAVTIFALYSKVTLYLLLMTFGEHSSWSKVMVGQRLAYTGWFDMVYLKRRMTTVNMISRIP